jgi:hypothetical protein
LKKEGLLAPDTRVENIDQLLDGIQSLAGNIADRIDTPPLSVQELRETLAYLRREAKVVKPGATIREEEVDSMLQEMRSVAEQEKRSLYEISTAMALNAMVRLERSGRTAATGFRVGRSLFDRTILEYYAKALRDISRLGYYKYLARSSKPYFRAIARHLRWRNITWTERYLLSHTWGRMHPDE